MGIVEKEVVLVDNKYSSVVKINEDQNLVFGWAYTSIDKDGERVVDHSGEVIYPEDLELAAYLFNLKFRDSGVMHEGEVVGKLVESFVVTPEKLEAIGITQDMQKNIQKNGQLPIGWWVGFYVEDNEVFDKVKNGQYSMFSIQGKALTEEVT